MPLLDLQLLESARVHDSPDAARRDAATRFGASVESVPSTFAGTIDGRHLILIERSRYEQTHAAHFPDVPQDSCYEELVRHEIAHRAHADFAMARFGSEDGMGPRWLYEGIAIHCADHFRRHGETPCSSAVLADCFAADRAGAPLDYRTYGRMIRTICARVTPRELCERGADVELESWVLDHVSSDTGDPPQSSA